jgi:predicted deacylase
MYQRQIMGVRESDQVRILATSNVNRGAVMIEEKAGKGRIVALDLLSPGRPFFNSRGATNKYLFLGNMVNQAVRYGKQYPKRLSYDEFVAAMRELAAKHSALTVQAEGPCSDGRQMYTFNLGDPAKPTMYFGGSIHGWEWENAYGLMRLAELLAENPRIEGLDTAKLHFKIMPIQNPWGHEHFTRQNARGVDLNRNFDSGWEELAVPQDVVTPWDYNYKGARPASERETQIIQGIIDRHRPICVIDFHTADYVMMRACRDDEALAKAIHEDIKARLKDRFLTQKPYNGPYQQVNMNNITAPAAPKPYLIDYAAKRGAVAAFLIEMSGNRDDVHALVMNTDTVVEICLAAVKQCLARS